MKIELDNITEHLYRIDSYERGSIIINGTPYSSSVIISPKKILTNWGIRNISDLAAQHIEEIISFEPEIIILGTGRSLLYPAMELVAPILENNIGFESMDTGAACRCYNLLMNEGRMVVACLLPFNGTNQV